MKNSLIDRILFRIQRSLHIVQLRNTVCVFLRLFLPNSTKSAGNHVLNLNSDERKIVKDLKKDGFSDLGIALSQEQIDSISKSLKNLKCYDTAIANGPEVDVNSTNHKVQLAQYKREDLVKIEEILDIANDSQILNVVSKYLGLKPTISNINCWWSFSDRDAAKEAQFFHRDLDDFKFLKIFFYLTDVTDQSGPHIYVKGSHKVNKLLELRRFSDDEVQDTFTDKNILTLTSPKGSAFIEDTYGIHKGQLPLNGNRLLLQIQYSFMPLFVENYEPKKEPILQTKGFDKYINRLLFVNN